MGLDSHGIDRGKCVCNCGDCDNFESGASIPSCTSCRKKLKNLLTVLELSHSTRKPIWSLFLFLGERSSLEKGMVLLAKILVTSKLFVYLCPRSRRFQDKREAKYGLCCNNGDFTFQFIVVGASTVWSQ